RLRRRRPLPGISRLHEGLSRRDQVRADGRSCQEVDRGDRHLRPSRAHVRLLPRRRVPDQGRRRVRPLERRRPRRCAREARARLVRAVPARGRRRRADRVRRHLAQQRPLRPRLTRPGQSTSRTRRQASGVNQSVTATVPPTARIVVGATVVASAAASAYPTGVRPLEPKKSRLYTRERSRSGTSSVRSVIQAATPTPIPRPRQTTATAASQYHGDSPTAMIPTAPTPNAPKQTLTRLRSGCQRAQASDPATSPIAIRLKRSPYEPTPRS